MAPDLKVLFRMHTAQLYAKESKWRSSEKHIFRKKVQVQFSGSHQSPSYLHCRDETGRSSCWNTVIEMV